MESVLNPCDLKLDIEFLEQLDAPADGPPIGPGQMSVNSLIEAGRLGAQSIFQFSGGMNQQGTDSLFMAGRQVSDAFFSANNFFFPGQGMPPGMMPGGMGGGMPPGMMPGGMGRPPMMGMG